MELVHQTEGLEWEMKKESNPIPRHIVHDHFRNTSDILIKKTYKATLHDEVLHIRLLYTHSVIKTCWSAVKRVYESILHTQKGMSHPLVSTKGL